MAVPALRSARDVLLAVAAFTALAGGQRELVPWADAYGLRDKLEYLAAHKDEYDALYLGSSATHRSFQPVRIDAELRARDVPLRSFNLGVAGGRMFELEHVLREVVAMRPARLRWVFYEPLMWETHLAHADNVFTDRTVGWHTPAVTGSVLDSIARSELTTLEKFALGARHLQLLAWNLVSFGDGPRALAARLGWDRGARPIPGERLAAEHGYVAPEDEPGAEFTERRAAFLASVDEYRADIADIDDVNGRQMPAELYDLRALARWRALVAELGAEDVPVLPPIPFGRPLAYAIAREGHVDGLLAFNSPTRHADLYVPEQRFDRGHLNRRGAELFSVRFADVFARFLRIR